MTVTNSNPDRKRVSRAQLKALKEQILEPLRSTPPTIGTYSRELDVALFRLFWPDVQLIKCEKVVTLKGREFRPRREVWVYEVPGTWDIEIKERHAEGVVLQREYVHFGDHQADGAFIATPDLHELPYFTSKTDDAICLKNLVIGLGRTLVIAEIDADPIPRWQAKIIASHQIVAEGETYDCAAAVALALLSDLIANDEASWWIDVRDDPDRISK
jgi:hypothetical protein